MPKDYKDLFEHIQAKLDAAEARAIELANTIFALTAKCKDAEARADKAESERDCLLDQVRQYEVSKCS
ncbi:MAG: hypothetical protein LBV80_08070 [Deltaproteobacteria bacterium]|jgi:uncharacterized coiled-coil DUF342 family protein|nr:hypothetical protein [Deltaproteobacteria bacterium]